MGNYHFVINMHWLCFYVAAGNLTENCEMLLFKSLRVYERCMGGRAACSSSPDEVIRVTMVKALS